MKLRRTRIKKTTKANGTVEYVAQYKYGLWWCPFDILDIFTAKECFYAWSSWLDCLGMKDDGSKESAKSLIEFYVKRVNCRNTVDMGDEVVTTDYEEYP